MKFIAKVIIFSIFMSFSAVSTAATSTEVFAECLVDNLDGRERKELTKWVFFAMAAHPEIQVFLKASSEDRTRVNKYMGALLTRLLTEDCSSQMKMANDADPAAITKAFKSVGAVAMQELMGNQNVRGSISGYMKYTDHKKINKILSE